MDATERPLVFGCSTPMDQHTTCGWLFPRSMHLLNGRDQVIFQCPQCGAHYHVNTDAQGDWELRRTAPTDVRS